MNDNREVKVYSAAATCELPRVLCELLGGESLEKKFIFCEDKFTLALELAVAERFGGSFGARVFSFNRYMHSRLTSEKRLVSPEGSALIIKRVLLENKQSLQCFTNVYEPNLAATVYELIAQLKSAKVTPAELFRAEERCEGNLKSKLKDLALIFSEYENYLQKNGLTDGNNRLYLLPELIKNSEEIKQAEVFVVGFSTINKTLCEIFKAMRGSAKSLSFVIACGENDRVYTNELYNFLTENFAPQVKKCESQQKSYLLSALYNPAFLKSGSGESFGGLNSAKTEQNPEKNGLKDQKLYFYKAQNKYEEIEHIARIIKARVINGDKYKNFAVAVENPADYSVTVKRVFGDYGIPYFIDETVSLAKHPLTLLVKSLIDFARKKTPEAFISVISNPAFLTDKGFADELENYVVKNAFSRRGINSPFIIPCEKLESFESVRKTVCEQAALFSAKTTFSTAVLAIERALELCGAQKNVQTLGAGLEQADKKELAAYNAQAYDKFLSVLNEIRELLGDKPATLSEVSNVIISGMTACKLALIPEFNDCVFIGEFRAVKYKEYEKLFMAGLTSSVPLAKADCALLCDKDLKKLDDISVAVEPKIKQVNRRARENACFAAAAFSKELFLSYPAWQSDGAQEPSEIFSGALLAYGGKRAVVADGKSMAVSAERAGQNRYNDYLALGYLSKRAALFSFSRGVGDFKEGKTDDFSAPSAYYSLCEDNEDCVGAGSAQAAAAALDKANCETAYCVEGADYIKNGASATNIEGFFACPYANFLERGLKLKDREKNDLAALDLGTMVHLVAEKFVEELKNGKINGEKSARKIAEQIFNEVGSGEEYARYKLSARGRNTFEMVKKEAVRFCVDTYKGCENSEFKPALLEADFGHGKYPPVKVKTRRGEMKITGKIDRVDLYGEKMRIIDYKTGSVKPADIDKNLYAGNKLQLFLYAGALSDKYKTAGAYYFPIADNFAKEGETPTMKMCGRTLLDEKTVIELDKGKADGGEQFIDANFSVSNGVIKKNKNFLSESEFNDYIEYSRLVAAEGLAEMKEGVIVASPYGEKCTYCKFRGVCGYDEEIQGLRRDVAADSGDISAAIEYEKSGATENRASGGGASKISQPNDIKREEEHEN